MEVSVCRIGLFYDGCYFSYAQKYYYHVRGIGWLEFERFHAFVESFIHDQEMGYPSHKIAYAGWYQGIANASKVEDWQLLQDRRLQLDLIRAGIHQRFIPLSMSQREKGVDVALAIDAFKCASKGTIDVAVLVTGDADFIPLAQALLSEGTRVGVIHFHYRNGKHNGRADKRLLQAASYQVNLSGLERSAPTKASFLHLFRPPGRSNGKLGRQGSLEEGQESASPGHIPPPTDKAA